MVFVGSRRQGYICRHPWERFQPFSAPRVHPPAPLGTFPATIGTANGSAHKDKKLSNLPCPDEMPLLGGGKYGYSRHDGNWNHGPEHCRHHKKQQQSGQFIRPCVNKTESFADNQGILHFRHHPPIYKSVVKTFSLLKQRSYKYRQASIINSTINPARPAPP